MLRSSTSFRSRLEPPVVTFLALLLLGGVQPARAEKSVVRNMYEVFSVPPPPSQTPAVAETTIRHEVFFDDLEGGTSGWSTVDFRLGQPNAWHLVTGTHSCVGQAWWCGQSGFPNGDGYNNNWVQILKTNTPINLAGTTGNTLTFKYRCQIEYGFDYAWVLIHDGSQGSLWDTLAYYSGNFGTSCVNASISIPDTWTTRPQPLQLMFLFGSDLTVSTADSAGAFTGWTIDDVRVATGTNVVKFFDDMESGSANWLASSPDPGTLWHVENSPGTSVPATCFFLNTNVWVPFDGIGFGSVPDFADAMVATPKIDLQGVFTGASSALRLQMDEWINLPADHGLYWSLMITGSNDGVTWTPWRNALSPLVFAGGTAQCIEESSVNFDPYNTVRTGVQPGTRYIRLGFRLRDEKAVSPDAILTLGRQIEGIYLDNITVDYTYTISGVEAVSAVPERASAAVQRIYPNPFNPSTTIEFSIPKSGPVALRIHDVQGRAVATLVHDTLPAGVYRVRWNGTTDDGRDLSSGVYFARVENAKTRGSARLMMLK